ncbi:MAG: methyltransferase domain-containing protein [Candidatus Rokubacteria bacterium]|nr:methyltransferase domain-containing protein [Candidatus Rokubacteria bacterium]
MSLDVERFRAIVAARLGLLFDDAKFGLLAEVLRRRIDASGAAPEVYLERLAAPQDSREEIGALAKELTVTETYFFRNMEQFRALVEIALPDRIGARQARRSLRFLSAGCASGEEAYSLAALVRQHLPEAASWDVSIRGVDINAAMIQKARRGRYSAWSLRETPADLQRRWFREKGPEFLLDESVRSMVNFEERNLAEDNPSFWQPQTFDIIFCRNVLMYFVPETARAIVGRLSHALVPGGYLFLGHAENLRGLSQDFHLRHTHDTFYYQRKQGDADRPLPDIAPIAWTGASSLPSAPLALNAPLASVVEAADSWVDAIRRAAERIQTLTESRAALARSGPRTGDRSPAAHPRWDVELAVELLRKERFAEALALVRELPPESADDPDVLLLRAVLLTQSGNLAEAEKVCADLLALDDLNTGAHYLFAICREGLGDRQGAFDHDQVAVYLDPGFAMPRLHLGLLARRAGEREAARRELGQALVLLQREDASRVLLFGGGFSRDTLVSLCRAELVACGGAP